MCGISGLMGGSIPYVEKLALVQKMNEVQKHRGPDDRGTFLMDHCALGHVRLSIIDLSAAGHQPMTYGERYTIVFNGEIYNYVELKEELRTMGYTFSTDTDTEVLLAAYACWGEKCLPRLNGFWAFAVYDAQEKTLFLSRDRYGVKPLYYTHVDGTLIFASEIKTLLACERIPRIANDQAVRDYLINSFVDCEQETFFKGISRLPAAHAMKVKQDGSEEISAYYQLDYRETLQGSCGPDEEKKFKDTFIDAIKMRLRADVPVGSCLSGGLDSSAIVCESHRQLADMGKAESQYTYSACYKGHPNDESEYIREVLDTTGVQGYTCYPSGESLHEDLDHLIYSQDEPFLSTSMYASYCVMRLAHEKGAKVLLDGQGADEMLCGYRKARVYYIQQLLKRGKPLSAIYEALLYLPYMRKKNSTLAADLNMLLQFVGGKSKKDVKREYLQPDFAAGGTANSYRSNARFLVNDFEKISLPALLRYVDRNSMAFSIEDRLPFLDYRLVDYSMQLPLNAKIHHGWSKYIMRKTLDMPQKIRDRKDKIGFYTPEGDWLQAYSGEYRALFEDDGFRSGKYIDREKLLRDWDTIIGGKDDIGIFRYICLEKWMRQFNVESADGVSA